ncbi:hypothetical protein KCU67_g18029, partial [Aureobasidium melanogenum]
FSGNNLASSSPGPVWQAAVMVRLQLEASGIPDSSFLAPFANNARMMMPETKSDSTIAMDEKPQVEIPLANAFPS